MSKFYNVLNDFLQMPYYRNFSSTSGKVHNLTNHEDAISLILEDNEFKKSEKKYTKKQIKNWLENDSECDMEEFSFVEQPCGKHSSPDFIVCIKNKELVAIEAKSSKTHKPLYNSGGIKKNYIYVFSSRKMNKTTIYLGEDIMSEEQQKVIDKLIKDQKSLEQSANKELQKLDTNNRGISYYTRPMIGQSGLQNKTNYFEHEYRELCENNVLDKFKDK